MRLAASRPSAVAALWAFAATMPALLVVGRAVVARAPGLAPARRGAPWIRYPDADWYLAFRGGAPIDHWRLLNGLGPSMANARRADVVVFGNSRTQFALPSRDLRRFERRTGLSVFNLASGFVEGEAFARELVERFDLRPPIAVVNVDGFFGEPLSPPALDALQGGRWGAEKVVFEEEVAARIRPILTPALPTFFGPYTGAYLLRSSAHGSWLPVHWPHHHRPWERGAGIPPADEVRKAATEFVDAMRARGTTVILACMPGTCSPEEVGAVAAGLGLEAVAPVVDGLVIGEGTHLCPASGHRFARAFLRDLERLDPVRRRIRPARHPRHAS